MQQKSLHPHFQDEFHFAPLQCNAMAQWIQTRRRAKADFQRKTAVWESTWKIPTDKTKEILVLLSKTRYFSRFFPRNFGAFEKFTFGTTPEGASRLHPGGPVPNRLLALKFDSGVPRRSEKRPKMMGVSMSESVKFQWEKCPFLSPRGSWLVNYLVVHVVIFHQGKLQLPQQWLDRIMDPGISESERQRRKESNRISTKINFAAWLIEVPACFEASFRNFFFGLGIWISYLHHPGHSYHS